MNRESQRDRESVCVRETGRERETKGEEKKKEKKQYTNNAALFNVTKKEAKETRATH